jgi:inner membrane protein YidH
MSNTPSGLNPATKLTKERNRLAADRTLMAWIRTSLALIGFGFGFGIGKVYDYLKSVGVRDSVDPIRRTLIFGGSFILLGMLALVAPSFSTFEFSSDSKNRISLTAPCDRLP